MKNTYSYKKINHFKNFIKDLPENNKTKFTDKEFNNCLNKWINETKYSKNKHTKQLLNEYILKKANQILDDIISKRE